MEDKGDVISIKFSSDMKILAVQRSKSSVVKPQALTEVKTFCISTILLLIF